MKKILFLITTFLSFTSYASTSINAQDIMSKQKAILQNFGNAILHDKGTDSKKLTAISFATQCKNNAPIYSYEGTYSFKDRRTINQNSLFQVGSITKSFISVIILQLAQEQKFSLDDPDFMKKWFPEYPKWSKITLRQLMNMTSGIPNNNDIKDDDIFRKFTANEYRSYIKPVTILNLEYQLPLDFVPGTQYEYSNTNYTLLGAFIERITHHSIQDEVQTRIIDKLNLHHTYFPKNKLAELPEVNKAEIVHGYNFYRQGSEPYAFQKYGQDVTSFSLAYANAAGAIASTPLDINTFIHALYHPGKLLNTAQIKELTTLISTENGQAFSPEKQPGVIGYGLGIFGFYLKEENNLIFWYQGETNGFQFSYFYVPVTQLYLIFGINSTAPILDRKPVLKFLDEVNELCEQTSL